MFEKLYVHNFKSANDALGKLKSRQDTIAKKNAQLYAGIIEAIDKDYHKELDMSVNQFCQAIGKTAAYGTYMKRVMNGGAILVAAVIDDEKPLALTAAAAIGRYADRIDVLAAIEFALEHNVSETKDWIKEQLGEEESEGAPEESEGEPETPEKPTPEKKKTIRDLSDKELVALRKQFLAQLAKIEAVMEERGIK